MLRRIVPALGVIALASPAAMSQEIAKGLFLDGWIDTIFTVTDSQYESADRSANNSAAFSSNAKVKIAWNVTDQVTGKIGVKFNNKVTSSSTTTTTTGTDTDTSGDPDSFESSSSTTTSSGSDAYLQEAFFSANVGNGFNVTAGKFISFVGLQSAEPTGLFRVGYTPTVKLYTSDVIGASVGYSNDVLSGAVYILNGNGLTDAVDSNNSANPALTNVSHSLGYGIDLTYNLPEKMGNVNLEAAWDPANEATGSDIYQVGLNATVKPAEKTTVLAEVIYRGVVNGAVVAGEKETKETIAWMLLANQVVATEGIPASVTGSVGQLTPGYSTDGTADKTLSEVAAAVLTNPFGTSAFGLNLEVAYAWYDGTKAEADADVGGTTVSLEGLIVIP